MVRALVLHFIRKRTLRSWHHVRRSLCSHCYLHKIKIISWDWITLLRRLLMLGKWQLLFIIRLYLLLVTLYFAVWIIKMGNNLPSYQHISCSLKCMEIEQGIVFSVWLYLKIICSYLDALHSYRFLETSSQDVIRQDWLVMRNYVQNCKNGNFHVFNCSPCVQILNHFAYLSLLTKTYTQKEYMCVLFVLEYLKMAYIYDDALTNLLFILAWVQKSMKINVVPKSTF